MVYIKRVLEIVIDSVLKRGRSVLLLGARQTGKTTMVNRFKYDFAVSLAKLEIRLKYEQAPDLLMSEIEILQKESG